MIKESWLDSVKKAFANLGGEAKYKDLYREVKKIRLSQNLILTSEWRASVRATIENYSEDSANFCGKNIFQKLGYGYWGIIDSKDKNNTPIEFNNNTIEGITKERIVLKRERNHKIAIECKIRDSFTCQACSFKYKEQIVECHHLIPLSKTDAVVTNIDNLITLCPTCHALAHILLKESIEYFDKDKLINEIKKIIKEKSIYFDNLE